MIIERPEGNKLVGLYRGKVLKHLPHGKLKVFIPGVYPDEYDNYLSGADFLPTAEQLAPLFAGSNDGNGLFSYPNISASVICLFLNGDLNFPIVVGSTLGGENAFSLYRIIDGLTSAELSVSTKHLMTSGSTHVLIDLAGCLSAIVMDPRDVSASVDYSKDAVVSEPIAHSVDAMVMMSNTGEIRAQANNLVDDCKLIVNSTSKNGKIDIKIQKINDPESFCRLYLDKNGNVFIESSSSIVLKTKMMSVNAEDLLDMNSTSMKLTAKTDLTIVSPAINLDSTEGHTTIRSRSGVKSF